MIVVSYPSRHVCAKFMCFQSIIILPVCCQQYIRSVTYLPMTRIILLFYIIDHDHIIFWACGVIQVLIWPKPALCARAGTVHKAALGPFIPSDKRLDSLAIEGLQGMSFLLVRECNRNSLITCYTFLESDPSLKGTGSLNMELIPC